VNQAERPLNLSERLAVLIFWVAAVPVFIIAIVISTSLLPIWITLGMTGLVIWLIVGMLKFWPFKK